MYEAAHAAVHLAYGERAKPHDTEWQEFSAKAERPARLWNPVAELPEDRRLALTRPT